MAPRRGLLRRGGRGGKHKRLSKQTIKSFFPDIAMSKLQGHHIWTGIPCNDLSSALVFQQGTTTSNTISVIMNANANGGYFYIQPGTDVPSTDTLNPIETYLTRYAKFRPMGCKVSVTVFSQDNGEVAPDGSVSNTQIATPFMLYGFPFKHNADGPDIDYANEWDGTASGYTADTIPQMKYGFRRITPGLGGKSSLKYSTYWDFAKVLGITKEQYLSDPGWCYDPQEPSNLGPVNGSIVLALALADYTPAVARQCTVDIKITQYGRWEGQRILFQ